MSPVERPYKSRKVRPCDRCRKRRTGCVIEGGLPCKRCAKLGTLCEFSEKVPPVNRHKATVRDQSTEEESIGTDRSTSGDSGEHLSTVDFTSTTVSAFEETSSLDSLIRTGQLKMMTYKGPSTATPTAPTTTPSERFNFDSEIWTQLFGLISGLDVTNTTGGIGPIRLSGTSANNGGNPASTTSYDDTYSIDAFKKHESIYMFDSTYLDPYLYLSKNHNTKPQTPSDRQITIRSMSSRNPLNVLMFHHIPGVAVDSLNPHIQSLMRPHIPKLMMLFLRHVNPFFPVFSRGRFYNFAKEDTKVFPSSLFSSILAVAVDWWENDAHLSMIPQPNTDTLVDVALKSVTIELANPCYGTIQACLLLTQKLPQHSDIGSGSRDWCLINTAYSLCQSMGLNVNCQEWELPKWEKRIRRRMWWMLFIQEKWLSVSLGRGSHIARNDWDVPMITSADFLYYSDPMITEKDHSFNVKGFCVLAELTLVVDDMSEELLRVRNGKLALSVAHHKVSILLERVQRLEEKCPSFLQINEYSAQRPVQCNAALAVAFLTVRVILHRVLLHKTLAIAEDLASEKPCLDQKHAAEQATGMSFDLSEHVLETLGRLQRHHLECFWYSWSRFNFATIASFFLLLVRFARTETEKTLANSNVEKLRWFLKSRSKYFAALGLSLAVFEENEYNAI